MFPRVLLAAAWLCLAVLANPARAQTVDVNGIKFNNNVALGGSALQLNGAGTRYKTIIKVYAAALYLPVKAATPEAVLAVPGSKRLHVVMLRDIDANELGKLFTRGMEDNSTREEFGKTIAGTLHLANMFAARKKLVSGDQFTIDYLPGRGTAISINGVQQGEPVKEPEFFNALMRIWLGKSPADLLLKNALLGITAAERPIGG